VEWVVVAKEEIWRQSRRNFLAKAVEEKTGAASRLRYVRVGEY